MPLRAHGPAVVRVTPPRAGVVFMCCLAALILTPRVSFYARAARDSLVVDDSTGTRAFGEGENWHYGRQRREASAGEERDEDGTLSSGTTCYGEGG